MRIELAPKRVTRLRDNVYIITLPRSMAATWRRLYEEKTPLKIVIETLDGV